MTYSCLAMQSRAPYGLIIFNSTPYDILLLNGHIILQLERSFRNDARVCYLAVNYGVLCHADCKQFAYF